MTIINPKSMCALAVIIVGILVLWRLLEQSKVKSTHENVPSFEPQRLDWIVIACICALLLLALPWKRLKCGDWFEVEQTGQEEVDTGLIKKDPALEGFFVNLSKQLAAMDSNDAVRVAALEKQQDVQSARLMSYAWILCASNSATNVQGVTNVLLQPPQYQVINMNNPIKIPDQFDIAASDPLVPKLIRYFKDNRHSNPFTGRLYLYNIQKIMTDGGLAGETQDSVQTALNSMAAANIVIVQQSERGTFYQLIRGDSLDKVEARIAK